MKYGLLLAPLVALVLLGAAPPPSLLDQGDAALADGDLTRAIELYEKAQLRTDDPGRVTLELAQARLLRAIKDDSASDLGEAEQLFRCLLDPTDPRRPQALFGLGNCLLQKAGERDADAALMAVEAYEQCLQATTAESLVADARYNLERARLLLSQIRKAEEEKQSKEPEPGNGGDAEPKPPKPREQRTNPKRDPNGNDTRPKPVGPPESAPREKGDNTQETSAPPPPGSNHNLRPVPDQPDLPPLSAQEALEHLKQANERIGRERRQHRLSLAKPPAEDVRDW